MFAGLRQSRIDMYFSYLDWNNHMTTNMAQPQRFGLGMIGTCEKLVR